MSSFYIYGEINIDTSLQFTKMANKLSGKSLDIFINSPGGDVNALLGMINTIKYLQRKGVIVTTIVDGAAWSAAAVIFAFGNRRIIKEYCCIMYHSMFWDSDTASIYDHKSYSEAVDRVYKQLITDMVRHCQLNITEEVFYDKCRNDWWLDPEQALQFKFATERLI